MSKNSTRFILPFISLIIHGDDANVKPANVVFVHATGAYCKKVEPGQPYQGQAHDYHAQRIHNNSRFYQDKRHQTDERYTHQILLPDDTITGPQLPDASQDPQHFGKWSKSGWGQKKDASKVAQHITSETDILMGVSRGGPAALRALELSKNKENLKLIVLESPYATIDDCVNYALNAKAQEKGPKDIKGHIIRALSWLPNRPPANLAKLALFQKGDHKGKGLSIKERILDGSPIDYVQHIPAGATTLITASVPDKTVPLSSTIALYRAIKKQNPNTYLLLLKDANSQRTYDDGFIESCHANQPNTQEGVAFQDLMQALRKRSGLTHAPEAALRGDALISGTKLPDYATQYLALPTVQPTTKDLINAGLYTPSLLSRAKFQCLRLLVSRNA